ncbi:MAG: hypothetical protein U0X71_01895 [Sphingobacteriaceae bacterium]|jgi:basic membrane lipoprotein Med (substrate-binding protein (PBP1-ABC) superfamily)|nr:MAG: hypothetical protein E6Q66_00895 [Pedobacter sp.]
MKTQTEYIEIVQFQLNEGVSDLKILNAEKGMEKHLSKNYQGFIGRQLLRGKDGFWVVILRMKSEQDMHELLNRMKNDNSSEIVNYRKCVNLKEARLEFYYTT